MRIIGVIDIRRGCAVHARGGVRDTYAPVDVVAGIPVDGDAVAVARVYVERLGVREIYVADLDGITRGVGAMNVDVLRGAASMRVPLMVDAGVSSARDAKTVLDAGASSVVVGLETLTSFEALEDICATVGGDRVVFSIDLRKGVPLAVPNVLASAPAVGDVAACAVAAGVGGLIVLDLARVGTGAGIDLDVMRAVRAAAPHVALCAGGGVRDSADLAALASAGCDGALIATALHRGLLNV